jgi:hypothetical protein
MQYIESSVIGIRSAAITLKRRTSPLGFVLFPMVHVAEPAFYAAVEARAGQCDLIVAEGTPSRYFPVQEWMSKIRLDHLVDQMTGLDLEGTGVPVQWEVTAPSRPHSGRRGLPDRPVAVSRREGRVAHRRPRPGISARGAGRRPEELVCCSVM